MLNSFLTTEVFIAGVRTYLQEFKYKNATTADLWAHLSKASGQDVASLMYAWTREMGYPLVTVKSESFDVSTGLMTVQLSQSRFLSGGELKPEEDKVVWWIPISVVTHLSPNKPSQFILSTKEMSISFPYSSAEDGYWKLNFNANGLYRVKLQETQISRLGKVLATNPEAIPTSDRVMLVSDAFALTFAGLGPVTAALEVVLSLQAEENYM